MHMDRDIGVRCFMRPASNFNLKGEENLGAPPRGSPKDFGTPVAKIDSPRGESIMPQSALRPDQLRTKAASLTLPQMALRLFGYQGGQPA